MARRKTNNQLEDPDVQLMLKIRQGDLQAFDQLVERNVSRIHGLVYRFMGKESLVDDITQDVFIKILKNANRYHPTAKFNTWLYRIVANMCFNIIRSRKNRRNVSLDNMGLEDSRMELRDPASNRPEESMEANNLSEDVHQAVDQLPTAQRFAIILNKFENKNYKEIAQILDITTAAVKSLLSRARENLRYVLRNYADKI